MKTVYMDHIAGTPVHPEVLEAMLPVLKENFGNPQSFHSAGQSAAQALEEAREKVAKLINAEASEIIFTSNGSEANNLGLKGLAWAHRKKGNHVVLSAVEHQSILNAAKSLERTGFTSTLVPVDKYGLVDPDDVKKAISQETVVVSVMLANSEVGTVEPIKEIAEVCRDENVAFHSDAVAAAGVIPVDVNDLGVHALSLSGNQFYGPKGVAALYVRRGTKVLPQIDGGVQEGGKRAGTENLAGIVGMGTAADISLRDMEHRGKKLKSLREQLVHGISQSVDHVLLTGHPDQRLPHHASFCVEFVEGEAMLLNLDMQGISVSSGSACTSKSLKASHVLLAVGLDHALAQGSLVFSLIESLTSEDIEYFLRVFPAIVERLRNMSPLYTEFLQEKKI